MIDIKALFTKITDYLKRLTPTYGSNSYGSWVKFPEGTMICWGSASVKTSTSGGKFGYYGQTSATFPQTFYAIPNVATNYYKSPAYWNSSASTVTASNVILTLAGDTNATNTVTYIAVGRWKSGGGIAVPIISAIERWWEYVRPQGIVNKDFSETGEYRRWNWRSFRFRFGIKLLRPEHNVQRYIQKCAYCCGWLQYNINCRGFWQMLLCCAERNNNRLHGQGIQWRYYNKRAGNTLDRNSSIGNDWGCFVW